MQNKYDELWALIYLISNRNFMDKASFRDYYTDPIKRGLSSKAKNDAVRKGRERSNELKENVLSLYYISRKKESLGGTEKLSGKRDHVVLCDLSPLQVVYYYLIITLMLSSFVTLSRSNRNNCNNIIRI
jgi:SNF2 family DNA or RNA helicase